MKWNRMIIAWLVCALMATGSARAEVLLQGVTEFSKEVELSTMATGVIAAVKVTEGQVVVAGDALAEVESDLQVARVAIARVAADATAPVDAARADLGLAKSRLTRIERAVSRGGAAKWELTEAQSAVTSAQARLVGVTEEQSANEARLALEMASLRQFTLVAPFDGRVVELFARTGALANGRDPLMVLVGGDVMRIVSFMPAEQLSNIAPGDTAPVDLSAPVNRSLEARVAAIDPRIEPGSGTVRVIFEFDNREIQSPAGVEAAIRLPDPS